MKGDSPKPLVSIGMPVYNAEQFLPQALDSLLEQDFDDFELIISDNASTDATQRICEEYCRRDRRIVYSRNEENHGAIYNFNRALFLARGKYFMWAAHDDRWEPRFLSELVCSLERKPDAVLAFCSCDRIDSDGNVTRVHRKYARLSHPNRLVRAQRYIWFPTDEGRAMVVYGVFRLSVLETLGGVKAYEPYECSDDMLALRVILQGDFVFVNELLFHKRDVPGSLTFKRWTMADYSAYYRSYRRVVRESDLSAREKIALLFFVLAHQFVYQYGRPIRRLFWPLRRSIGRFMSRRTANR